MGKAPSLKAKALFDLYGRLLEEQYKELLTPGTSFYKQCAQQVDTIAVYLKQLQEAKFPVLWRPYHEMNGDWFWWGGLVGQYSTIDIYKQLYDWLVDYHKLNNLVWVWKDRPSMPIRKFSNFYPENKYFDILSLDVYGSDFNQVLFVKKYSVTEYGENHTTNDDILLNGSQMKSKTNNSSGVSEANWDETSNPIDSLQFDQALG